MSCLFLFSIQRICTTWEFYSEHDEIKLIMTPMPQSLIEFLLTFLNAKQRRMTKQWWWWKECTDDHASEFTREYHHQECMEITDNA